MNLEEDSFLDIGEIKNIDIPKGKGIFDAKPCSKCGELTFVDKLKTNSDGEEICIPCFGNKK